MTSYTLDRSNGPPLKFEGQLVAETAGSFDENGRGYAIILFQSNDGFVVDIKFWSAKDCDPVVVAEFVELSEDVEKVLYVFEPLEHLHRDYVASLGAEARQTLTTQLFKLYDKEVRQVLKTAGLASPLTPQAPSNLNSKAV